MTNLEFIEKEIKNIKEFLNDSVNVIGKNTKDTNFWEQRLHHFQQIKAELEAWEVVKNKISIEKGSINYANINIKDWHHHLTKKEFEILEKVLEVKD